MSVHCHGPPASFGAQGAGVLGAAEAVGPAVEGQAVSADRAWVGFIVYGLDSLFDG